MRQTAIPQIRVIDASRDPEFYTDGLGLSLDREYLFEPVLYGLMNLSREGQTLLLSEHTGDCSVGGAPNFGVCDTTSLYDKFKVRGVVAAEAPPIALWQAREVADPGTNRLRFASDIGESTRYES